MTKSSEDFDEKYMKTKINLGNELSLNKTVEIYSMIIVATAVFHENNKFYQQAFLDECLYMLY